MPRGIIPLIFSLFCLFENVAKISTVGLKKDEEEVKTCALQPHTLYSSNYVPFSRAPCPPTSLSSQREVWDAV